MRWLLCLLVACKGGDDGTPGDDDDAVGDDDDLTPWSEVVTTQEGECCRTVEEVFEWTTFDHDGLPAMHAIPEDPVGLLLVFHGTDGVLETVRQTEWVELYNLLYPRGIGIAATLSEDRVVKQWDTSEGHDNVDVPRVDALLGVLAADTAFELDMPVVTIGFSQGSSFSELFADVGRDLGRNVVGCVMHNGGGGGADGLPTLFVDAENDNGASRMAGYAADHEQGTLLEGTEEALHPHRFAKLSFYSPEQSQGVFDELVGMGVVDEQGQRLVDLGADPEVVVQGIENALRAPYPADLAQQLRVVWAMHRFSAQHKLEEAAWIEDRIR